MPRCDSCRRTYSWRIFPNCSWLKFWHVYDFHLRLRHIYPLEIIWHRVNCHKIINGFYQTTFILRLLLRCVCLEWKWCGCLEWKSCTCRNSSREQFRRIHKGRFPLGGILRAERYFPCDWKSWTAFNFVAAQFWRKMTLHAQNSAKWKTGLNYRSSERDGIYAFKMQVQCSDHWAALSKSEEVLEFRHVYDFLSRLKHIFPLNNDWIFIWSFKSWLSFTYLVIDEHVIEQLMNLYKFWSFFWFNFPTSFHYFVTK